MNCPVKTYLSAMKNRQKNPAKTTGNRYSIGILMSRTQRRKGLSAASLILQTLNDNPYLDQFKEGLFMYRKDGTYSIDNNLVERQVRPFTALRKTIQYYGSDAGAEMAAVYLSVVSTVKLAGQSVWRFIGGFFVDMVTGGKKHLSLLSL